MTYDKLSDIDVAEIAKRRSRDPLLYPRRTDHSTEICKSPCPFGPDLQGYWDARHRLFSKFDEGIKVDRQGLHSLKFEAAALEIGRTIQGDRVLDPFCGVGGSAIGIARAGKRVISIDLDKERLEMAAHNARIYGVADQIEFVHGEAVSLMGRYDVDAIYLDPPWGGSVYIDKEWFAFDDFQPDGKTLLAHALKRVPHVVFTLPVNFDLRQISDVAKDCFLQWSYFDDDKLFLTAYFGFNPFATDRAMQLRSS